LALLYRAFSNSIYPALIGVWLMAGARGVFLPANQAIMHESLPENVRSTGLSMMNFIFETIVAIGFFSSSFFVDHISASTAWWISGAAFLFSVVIIFIFRRSSNEA
jgi:predicted MFS family arabinose efflux permease